MPVKVAASAIRYEDTALSWTELYVLSDIAGVCSIRHLHPLNQEYTDNSTDYLIVYYK